jgi:hypothetical protein
MKQKHIDRINALREIMESTAKHHQFDLQHPDILKISREIDELVLLVMKTRPMMKKTASTR